jgi:hypothetical protein
MPIKHGYVGAKCNPSFDLTWVFVHILVLCNSFTDLPLHAHVFFFLQSVTHCIDPNTTFYTLWMTVCRNPTVLIKSLLHHLIWKLMMTWRRMT